MRVIENTAKLVTLERFNDKLTKSVPVARLPLLLNLSFISYWFAPLQLARNVGKTHYFDSTGMPRVAPEWKRRIKNHLCWCCLA